jgi:Ca2+-binding RTX toxin-like protein
MSITINGSGDYGSLEDALQQAGPGDTLVFDEDMYGNPAKGHTIDIEIEGLTLQGANAGTAAQDHRDPESVLQGYINVTADNVTIDGFRIDSTHKSGGDQFINLAGNDVSFVNNIATLETPGDGGGNGVSAGTDDTVEDNIFAWQGNLMGRGDTGFDGAPVSNDVYGAYWGNDGSLDEGWQTEFIIGTAGADDLGPDARAGQPSHDKDLINEQDLTADYAAKLNVFIRGEAGDDTIHGSEEQSYAPDDDYDYPNREQSGDDTLIGGAGDDTMKGLSGDDTIDGGAGDDKIYGDEADDALYNDLYNHFNPDSDLTKDGQNPPDDDVASWAYAAQSADGYGSVVGFEEDTNVLTSGSVVMSNWYGYDSSGESDGEATSGYTHDFTLELYEVDRESGTLGAGGQIATFTETQEVPGREIPVSENASFVGNGTDFLMEWDLGGIEVGQEVLFMVSFDIPDGDQNEDALKQLNIAAEDDDNPSLDVTEGVNPDEGVYWRSDERTDGEIARFDSGEVLSKFEGKTDDGGDDVIYGQAGDDKLFGGTGDDKVFGGAGADTLASGLGTDTLNGGGGTDVYQGEASDLNNDEIDQIRNNETIRVLDFTDAIFDRDGTMLTVDGVVSDGSPDGSIERFTIDVGRSNGDFSVNETEDGHTELVFDAPGGGGGGGGGGAGGGGGGAGAGGPFTPNDDSVSLGDGPNDGDALAGDDIVYGNAGADSLVGNLGEDEIYGNQGEDEVYGNQGDDLVFGGQDDDLAFGGQDDDEVYGNRGEDQVYGNMGSDDIFGGQENDDLFGGQDDDLIYGNLGDDRIYGNLGNDTLFGGEGDDDFAFLGGDGQDTVADFGDGDTISLAADINDTGVQSFADLTITENETGDAVIDLGGDNSLTVEGVSPDGLSESDFSFF